MQRFGEVGMRSAVGSELVVFEIEGEENPTSTTAPQVLDEKVQLAPPGAERGGKILAAPAVRARAKTLSIDLSAIKGTGEGGRILHADLDAILTRKPATGSAPENPRTVPDGVEEVKVFGLRRRIAERMLQSKRSIPHFTYVEEVDMTALEDLRSRLNTSLPQHHRLTILPFLIRAMVKAIARYPDVNAHYDGEQGVIRRFGPVHIGIATQTERGLLVPVIHNAQDKDVHELAQEIARLSADARSGKSKPDDLAGSTITVTSLGALGGIAATPIINPPEVAIIGVNKLAQRAVVKNGETVIREMMNLSSSFDHRIVDGYVAAAFIKSIKDELEGALPV